MTRLYGNNNLPDSSNMCHESTSVGLPKSIGVPVGTVHLEDFARCDCMLTPADTAMITQNHQLKPGGDLATLTGPCKAVVALDDAAREAGDDAVVDHASIEEHTHGFQAFCEHLRSAEWPAIEAASGLERAGIESAAAVIAARFTPPMG